MAERKIVLSETLDTFVEASVASGRYGNASEVVSAALHLLEGEEDARRLEALRAEVQRGLDDLDEGRFRVVPDKGLEDYVGELGSRNGRRRTR